MADKKKPKKMIACPCCERKWNAQEIMLQCCNECEYPCDCDDAGVKNDFIEDVETY